MIVIFYHYRRKTNPLNRRKNIDFFIIIILWFYVHVTNKIYTYYCDDMFSVKLLQILYHALFFHHV